MSIVVAATIAGLPVGVGDGLGVGVMPVTVVPELVEPSPQPARSKEPMIADRK
jgi:hypothetical protein